MINRRTLMQQLRDLQYELTQALTRAELAEEEGRILANENGELRARLTSRLAPLPPEIPAMPIAEEAA